MTLIKYIFAFIFISSIAFSALPNDYFEQKYGSLSDKIIEEVMNDSLAWQRLAYMCDMFGPRLSGSDNLENALNWIESEFKKDNFANVNREKVLVPNWRRNYEKCELIYPRIADIPILGLGGTIATPKEGITGKVIVVKSFEELEEKKDAVKGKIVVFNQPFLNYGQSVQFRSQGAIRAAKLGAVASLIRSVSPNTSRNLHTGMMVYNDTVPKIPHAAISPEDAMRLER